MLLQYYFSLFDWSIFFSNCSLLLFTFWSVFIHHFIWSAVELLTVKQTNWNCSIFWISATTNYHHPSYYLSVQKRNSSFVIQQSIHKMPKRIGVCSFKYKFVCAASPPPDYYHDSMTHKFDLIYSILPCGKHDKGHWKCHRSQWYDNNVHNLNIYCFKLIRFSLSISISRKSKTTDWFFPFECSAISLRWILALIGFKLL